MKTLRILACTALVAGLAAVANGQVMWSDDFESYAVGSGIFGQGGWSAWDDDPTWNSYVTDAQALSGTNSLDITGDSDTTYPWVNNGLVMKDDGLWRITFNTYVPSNLVAANDTYFILLSEYAPNYDWRVQMHFDPDTDTVIVDFDGQNTAIVYDQWVPIKVEVDLYNDLHWVWYGNTLLIDGLSWTGSMNGGGIKQIASCDLFAFGASSVYYDDCSVEYLGDTGPCLDVTWDNNNAGGTVKFCATGGPQGRQVGIFYSFNPTAFDNFVACWDDCRGQGGSAVQCAQVCLGSNFDNQIGIGTFDSNGTYCVSVKVPCAAGGKTVYIYAVTVGTDGKICDSEVKAITFNPC